MNNKVLDDQESNLKSKPNNINCSFNNGNYKFSFEIIQKSKEKININIELGFEIIYQEENSSEINIDEESSESSEDSIFFNPVYKKLYILENISLHKMKNIYDVILSIPKRKFLIMRNKNNKENILINDNKNISFDKRYILFTSELNNFPHENIKEVNPIFNYNKKILNVVDIKMS